MRLCNGSLDSILVVNAAGLVALFYPTLLSVPVLVFWGLKMHSCFSMNEE